MYLPLHDPPNSEQLVLVAQAQSLDEMRKLIESQVSRLPLANGWSLRCFSVAIYEKKQIKLSEPNLYSYSYIQEKWIELQWYIYVLLLLFKVWLSSVGQPKVYSCLPAWGYSSKSGARSKRSLRGHHCCNGFSGGEIPQRIWQGCFIPNIPGFLAAIFCVKVTGWSTLEN